MILKELVQYIFYTNLDSILKLKSGKKYQKNYIFAIHIQKFIELIKNVDKDGSVT